MKEDFWGSCMDCGIQASGATGGCFGPLWPTQQELGERSIHPGSRGETSLAEAEGLPREQGGGGGGDGTARWGRWQCRKSVHSKAAPRARGRGYPAPLRAVSCRQDPPFFPSQLPGLSSPGQTAVAHTPAAALFGSWPGTKTSTRHPAAGRTACLLPSHGNAG